MSFNEIYATSTVPSNKPEENSVIALSQLLGRLEKLISHTKSKLIVYKQGNDSHLYTELEQDMKAMALAEAGVRRELDNQMKQLSNMPRTAAAPKRVAFSKIEKELEALKSEALSFRNTFASLKDTQAVHTAQTNGTTEPQIQLSSTMQVALEADQSKDDSFELERLQEIRRINEDLVLVNEMFRDMAEIIRSQDAPIAEIADKTEASNQRVAEGLRQIQIAADAQPHYCAIS